MTYIAVYFEIIAALLVQRLHVVGIDREEQTVTLAMCGSLMAAGFGFFLLGRMPA